jgi:pyridoxal phosphate enzyme (YggS family)
VTGAPPELTVSPERRAELASRLQQARQQVADAARAAGRNPDDVHIVAVTKRFDAADVVALAELGVQHVGENRHQEAAPKHAAVAAAHLPAADALVWHFIGQLQTNKAKAVAAYADQVDTVDRLALVSALSRGAVAAGRTVGVCVQVSLAAVDAGQAHRGGCAPPDAGQLADAVAAAEGLTLRGVMGMAPLGGDPAAAFARLADVAAEIRASHPGAEEISAGMSGDFVAAIAAGATHVRLGTAILGERPQVG